MPNGLWINQHQFVEFAPPRSSKSLSAEIATRERSIDFSGLGMYLPNPDQVLKKLGRDITVYKELLTDPHVGACMESRQSGTRSRLWEIDRGKSKSRQAKFIDSVFRDLDMERILSEMLDGALFGYQPMEIMWRAVAGRWVPVDIVGKPPEWFCYDEQGNLKFKTRADWNGEPVPDRKFVVPRHRAGYANPYGFPVLSRCFWPVTFKKGGWKFWVTFTEKYGMPWVIGKHKTGASDSEKDNMLDMLEKMIQDGIAVIPEDASVDSFEHKGATTSVDLYSKLIETCNGEISKAIQGQTLTTEIGDTGSYAASKTHADVRQDIVDSDSHMVSAVINQVIDWTIQLNFGGTGDRPRFILYDEEDIDLQLSERDKNLTDTGRVRLTKAYYRRAYGFADDEIEVIDRPEPAPATPQQFAAAAESDPQEMIDDLAENIPDDLLQQSIEQTLEPVIEHIRNADSYDDIQTQIADLYPMLDDSVLQQLIEKAMLLSQTWGRISTREA